MAHLKRFVIAALLLLISSQSITQADRLKIIASFSILADVVGNVAGDSADVTALIPVGADPHSFSPSPQDIAAVAEADVVFINGIDFEASLMEAIENAGGEANIVTVSWCVPVIALDDHEDEAEEKHDEEASDVEPGNALMAERCAAHYAETDEEAAEHDHDVSLGALYEINCGEHDEEDNDVHEHGNCDPHVWTDPHNVIYWTLMIRDTLIELDGANAEFYQTNADAYIEQLESLIHDFIEPSMNSVPEENRVLVTNHETLGYLATAYNYEIIGTVIAGGATGSAPAASDVAALIDLVRSEGVQAIFAENTVNADIAQQVAAESGASFYTLLSDSLSGEGGEGTTYIDYMRYNVSTIVSALSNG
jgi:ABC-type Zn uptake system ZnuABC Zn-binding protein ZnuA